MGVSSQHRKWGLRLIAAAAALVGTGYVSSFMSLDRCESASAERLARELDKRREISDTQNARHVFVLTSEGVSPTDYPGSEATLRKAGFTVRQCVKPEEQSFCVPWAGVARAKEAK